MLETLIEEDDDDVYDDFVPASPVDTQIIEDEFSNLEPMPVPQIQHPAVFTRPVIEEVVEPRVEQEWEERSPQPKMYALCKIT